MRFDRNESPSYVNEGKGWRDMDAVQWLDKHELSAQKVTMDDGYIRAKQYDATPKVEGHITLKGVMVMRCERQS